MGSSKKHKKDRDESSSLSRKRRHKKSPGAEHSSPGTIATTESSYEKERRRKHKEHKEKRHKHEHKDKDKRHRRRAEDESTSSRAKNSGREEYHSDSSDVIEVPIAPPAPIISNTTVTVSQSKRARSASPIPENGAGDCLSIEQTNKIRAKLGLKPLEVEKGPINKKSSSSGESRPRDYNNKKSSDSIDPVKDLNQYKDDYGEFYHKPAVNLSEKKKVEKIRDKLSERREKRKQEEKLTSLKTLGEADDDENATNWVAKSREKEKSKLEADRRAKVLEEMDAEFGVSNLVEQETRKAKRTAYMGKDLRGLVVEHDLENLSEGKDVILTLKDHDVLDDTDDTLINVNLIDDERYKKNVENRKLNPNLQGYNVYDDEMVDEFGIPISRPILGKYDEEIAGNRAKSTFTLGENLQHEVLHKRKLLEIKSKLAGKRLETLDDTKLQLASEYYSTQELTAFKKPKKKVKKIRQKLKADDLLALTELENNKGRVDSGSRKSRTSHLLLTDDVPEMKEDLSNYKVEDDEDDDLQHILSKARRLKQKEALITKPLNLEMAKIEMKSEPNSEDDDDEMSARDANIVLDATAEFCRTLGDIPTYGLSGNRDEEANNLMDFDENVEENELEQEEMESSVGVWSSVNPDAEKNGGTTLPIEMLADVAILDEEPDVSSGIGGALQLAMSKGYLEREESNRPSGSGMAHLQAKNYSIEDKAYGDDDKFGRRDRYHSGPTVDFKEKETFKPNVKLEYIDDSGRLLSSKEAFRYLSHKFHGKGPGKNKIEKRLKKNEQDTLMMKMNSTDTPLGTLNMLQMKQRETKSPYIVLSGSKQTHANSSIVKKMK